MTGRTLGDQTSSPLRVMAAAMEPGRDDREDHLVMHLRGGQPARRNGARS